MILYAPSLTISPRTFAADEIHDCPSTPSTRGKY
jgi:hypothetical protein